MQPWLTMEKWWRTQIMNAEVTQRGRKRVDTSDVSLHSRRTNQIWLTLILCLTHLDFLHSFLDSVWHIWHIEQLECWRKDAKMNKGSSSSWGVIGGQISWCKCNRKPSPWSFWHNVLRTVMSSLYSVISRHCFRNWVTIKLECVTQLGELEYFCRRLTYPPRTRAIKTILVKKLLLCQIKTGVSGVVAP